MKILFQERQRFTQWWLWLILFFVLALFGFVLYKQLVLGEIVGDKPASDGLLVAFALLVVAIGVLFSSMRLHTEINEKEIQMQFKPFVKRTTKWSEVQNAKVLDYGFVGGWGIRIWTSFGTVCNIRGRKGLAIELKNGKKYLIGTQQPEALVKALQEAKLAR